MSTIQELVNSFNASSPSNTFSADDYTQVTTTTDNTAAKKCVSSAQIGSWQPGQVYTNDPRIENLELEVKSLKRELSELMNLLSVFYRKAVSDETTPETAAQK